MNVSSGMNSRMLALCETAALILLIDLMCWMGEKLVMPELE